MLVSSYLSEGVEELAYQFVKYLWILTVWGCQCVCPDSSVISEKMMSTQGRRALLLLFPGLPCCICFVLKY